MGERGRHAVVIGSGIAGLTAARVLAEHYDRVSLLEHDHFPSTPEHRPGVPQSRHLHGLQRRGAEILYELFPGLYDDLRADGASAVHAFDRVKIVTPAGLLPLTGGDGEPALFYSRFHLEWRLRGRLGDDERVVLRGGVDVVGLVAPRGEVRGVRVRPRDGGDEETVEADLVVDASGRRSHLTDWLAELGHSAVAEETLTSELSYASRFYARPEGFPDDFALVICSSRPPGLPRAGLVQDIENGQWHVTLGGADGATVPTDEEGFLAWAKSLADPSVYEAVRVARPLTPIRGWRTPTSRWRHLERMPDWPAGLIALGDAVCALNPIYGQGMTVAAMEALELRSALRSDDGGRRDGFERRFQRRLAQTVTGPWLVASTEDLRWPSVRLHGARPPRGMGLLRAYLDRVLAVAVGDRVVAEAYFGVIAMTGTPASLFAPRVLTRLARHALGRAVRPRSTVPAPGPLALSPEGLAAARAMPAYDGAPVPVGSEA